MDIDRRIKPCDCKGKRTCLLCENLLQKKPRNLFQEYQDFDSYVYCIACQCIFKGWDIFENCGEHDPSTGRKFPGVLVVDDFLTSEESNVLVEGVDHLLGWDASQSGRRKKNFGPKVNFKKKKLSVGKFEGFPILTRFVRDRLKSIPLLGDFEAVEECFLEYDAARGSHIEPHIDDCWIWGERIVTVNCIGDSVLTVTKHAPLYEQQYNIDFVEQYKNHLISPLGESIADNVVIRIPMPENSILVLYGPPRYQYEHSVLREDIVSRRVAIAYREFTIPYQKNSHQYSEAEEIYKLCGSTLL